MQRCNGQENKGNLFSITSAFFIPSNGSAFTFLSVGVCNERHFCSVGYNHRCRNKSGPRICMQNNHSTMTTSSLMILKYILCTLKGNTYRRFVFLDLCRVKQSCSCCSAVQQLLTPNSTTIVDSGICWQNLPESPNSSKKHSACSPHYIPRNGRCRNS